MSTSIIQMSDKTKGETVEKERRSKNSLKSKTKSEEREIYFIIFYPWNEKETPSDLIFSEDCEIPPETILIKEIKTSNNKFLYKKVFKYKNNKDKTEDKNKYIISFKFKRKIIYIWSTIKKRT